MRNRLGFPLILTAIGVLPIIALPMGTTYSFNTYRDLAKPPTPISNLHTFAGSGQTVHVVGKLAGRSKLKAANGTLLGYQQVQVETSIRHSTLYEGWAPVDFVLTDNGEEITVHAEHGIATGYIKERAAGPVRGGQLPPDVAALRDPDLKKLPVHNGDLVKIWTFAKDEPVSVYGSISEESGKLVLHDPDGWFHTNLIMMPHSAATEALAEERREAGGFAIALAIELIILALGLVLLRRRIKSSR